MSISKTSPRAGFTLVEMLIVLAILAALSTVALRSADSLQNRARYEATRNTLEDVETALLGSRSGLPGEVRAGGLLADTGRFLDSADPSAGLTDLLIQPGGVQATQFSIPSIDPGVQLACGWRGPYIRVLTGTSSPNVIEDGWGRPIVAVFDSGTATWTLKSPGADGILDNDSVVSGYDLNVSLVLPPNTETAELAGAVTLTPSAFADLDSPTPDPAEELHVTLFVFEPDPQTGTTKFIRSDATPLSVSSPTGDELVVVTYKFSTATLNALSPGPKVIRAYATRNAVPPNPTAALETVSRSQPLSLTLLHGAQTIDLTIDR